jgi:shikimate kinase
MMNAAKRPNIILCGFMATGKSVVGKQLATMIGYDFFDMDAMIETETGMSIPQIFSSQGEAAFRQLESRMAEHLAARTGCVIASGGGTIVNPKNFEILKQSGVIITLTADTQAILSRVGIGDDRPMLHGENKLEQIDRLMQQRAGAYAKADIIVNTSSKSVDEVARNVLDSLCKLGIRFEKKQQAQEKSEQHNI